MANSYKVLHLLFGDYSIDSRVRNETETLARSFDLSVFCLSKKHKNRRPLSEQRRGVRVESFKAPTGLFSTLSIWFQMILHARKLNPSLVHAHDIQSLPLGFLIALFTGSKFIYDSHELWSQSHHKPRSKLVLNLATWLERAIAHRCDAIITVSGSIAIYLSGYFRNSSVHVIRNIPTYTALENRQELSKEKIREKYGIAEDKVLFIYQGLIKKERGVFLIAKAFALLETSDSRLLFLGSGPDMDGLKEEVVKLKLSERVVFQESVDQDLLGYYTKAADVGVHAIQNSCLNHEYCLPNKLFEYISCGLPVVVTRLKEMDDFVQKNQLGLTFDNEDPEKLALCMKQISKPEELKMLKSSVNSSRSSWEPEQEYQKLVDIYEDILC